MKTCSKCGEDKQPSDFYGKMTVCKVCHGKRSRQWAKVHPDKVTKSRKKWQAANKDKSVAAARDWQRRNPERVKIAQRSRLLKSYGLTEADYDRMMIEQNGCCEVCFVPFENDTKICVDHDHVTHAVRGLLHDSCNRGIGLLGDNEETLRRAADYVARHRS